MARNGTKLSTNTSQIHSMCKKRHGDSACTHICCRLCGRTHNLRITSKSEAGCSSSALYQHQFLTHTSTARSLFSQNMDLDLIILPLQPHDNFPESLRCSTSLDRGTPTSAPYSHGMPRPRPRQAAPLHPGSASTTPVM
jgi:hypothetical protein